MRAGLECVGNGKAFSREMVHIPTICDLGQLMRDLPHTKVPCKDCQFREPGCHGKCEMYREWRKELTAVRQRERLEKPESMEWQLYHKGK